MIDIIIGLFMNIMAQFIHNPHTASKYLSELSHIQNGIDAIKQALQPKVDVPKQ